MDTITHGIAGALIGKAFCKGDDMFPSKPMDRARIMTWSLVLGAIFRTSTWCVIFSLTIAYS